MPLTESAQKFPKNRARKQNKSLGKLMPIAFAILTLLVVITGFVYVQLDKPRVEATVVSNIESNNGEVVKIVHRPGKARQGYVDAVFDGKQSRCVLHLLDQKPPVFDCDPAVIR